MEELATLIEGLLGAGTDEARAEILSLMDLDATEAAIQEAGAALLSADNPSDSDIDEAHQLATAKGFIAAERDRRAVASADRATKLAGAKAALAGETVTVDAEVEAPAADTDAEATDEPAVAELSTEVVVADTPAEVPVVVEIPVPVPAVMTPAPTPAPTLAAIRALTPAPAAEVVPAVTPIPAYAQLDIPNRPVGTQFSDIRELADAFISRQSALGAARGGGVEGERVPIARFSYLDRLNEMTEDSFRNGELLKKAGAPQALTAAGGFCATNETVYSFVKVNTPDGLAQDFLPTVGAARGSIQYPVSPDIRTAFTANASRAYSNANDIAGVVKTVTVIACPSTQVCTVGAQYLILQFGNFGARAYPEWVEHWIGLSMDAHAHQVSAKLILQMVAASNAVVSVGPNAGATSTIFSNLGLAAADMRSDLRMAANAQLEVVLPIWTPDLIRSDMARATKSTLETLNITDAQIASWFSVLNLTPRYVTDWETVSGNNATGATVWPSGLRFIMYPPGTFVKLDQGTLDLGVVRDSVLNKTNDFTIFVETFESVCKPGIESRVYSMSICANGSFSADQNLSCTGVDIPAS